MLGSYLAISAIIVALVGIVVLTHWEALIRLAKVGGDLPTRRHMTTIMLGLVVVHVFEVHVFALAYFLLNDVADYGVIVDAERWLDFVYFSAATYTTLGFGDLVPQGLLRLLTAIESLLGLALITWSASFTYLKMSKLW